MLLRNRYIITLTFILLSACVPSRTTPQPADLQPAAAFTAVPTLTVSPATPTYAVSPLDDAANVAYYFAPELCNAKWSNSGVELPCPNVENQTSGYAGLLTEVELKLPYKAHAILAVPSQDGVYRDIFGAFPPIQIEFADFFRAQLYCLPETQCDVTFSLGYYDSTGKFSDPFPGWTYNYTELPKLVNFPLSSLTGQTVRLMLIVRDNNDPIGDFAVWVEPRIFRHPGISTPTP